MVGSISCNIPNSVLNKIYTLILLSKAGNPSNDMLLKTSAARILGGGFSVFMILANVQHRSTYANYSRDLTLARDSMLAPI